MIITVSSTIYGDDIQLTASSKISDIPVLISQIQRCVSSACAWCSARRLQPKPSKTEVIWFGTSASLAKLRDTDVGLQIGADMIQPSTSIRDLGIWLDSELSMKLNIGKCMFLPAATFETGSQSYRTRRLCEPCFSPCLFEAGLL